RDYNIDKSSRSEWETQVETALKCAKQVVDAKGFPWPGAANVKYPLVTTAAIQFHARSYPEIVKGNEVVKARTVGEDPDGRKQARADRVSQHMSWQCMEEMKEWDEETDKLLLVLPIVGSVVRKTYFDPTEDRNKSVLVLPENLIVHYKARSLESSRRKTEIIDVYKNEVWENVQAGVWLDVELGAPSPDGEHQGDEDAPFEFLEQHRYFDLDEDGYEEPYIVTVLKDSGEVVRIKARYDETGIIIQGNKLIKIEPIEYYTHYQFVPSPDGGFYGIGFGILLNGLNETINT